MQLVTSLTVDASLLRRLLRLWDAGGDPRNPFAVILVTPLFASPSTLKLIREEFKEKRGAVVYFDSGGYYAQQGKIAFSDLYRALRDYYRDPENQWADWYVLPDDVPTSADDPKLVAEKVNNTVTAATLFHAEMPSNLRSKAMPVIQGHTLEQIYRCLDTYRELDFSYLGFGSFGTNGANSSINVADRRSVKNVGQIAKTLGGQGIRLHTFGVSTPPLIYAFEQLGIHSFDSLAWQRSAGYGKVYLPFTRAYNVSHRSTQNAALGETEFGLLKERTGHFCPFCTDFSKLREDRLHRSLHNLVAVMETISVEGRPDRQFLAELISWKSERYYRLFEDVYLGQ